MIKRYSFTVDLDDAYFIEFKQWLNGQIDVIDFYVFKDTDELYENDPKFKQLADLAKKAKKEKEIYINKHGKDS